MHLLHFCTLNFEGYFCWTSSWQWKYLFLQRKYLIALSSDSPCSWWKVRNHFYCFSSMYNVSLCPLVVFNVLFLLLAFNSLGMMCFAVVLYTFILLGFFDLQSSKSENMWSWCLQIVLLSHVSLLYFCTVVRHILTWLLLFYRLMRHSLFFPQYFFSLCALVWLISLALNLNSLFLSVSTQLSDPWSKFCILELYYLVLIFLYILFLYWNSLFVSSLYSCFYWKPLPYLW